MISVQKISKNYGSIKAVKEISFGVTKGEILGLLGPNGAGKTTTMRILTCFMPPSQGTATVGGCDILENPMGARRSLGYMPENPPIYPEMKVADFLQFVARIKEVPAAQIPRRVERTMERLHIHHIRGRIIGHLSRGYRQRVGLAQALVHEPNVLILDEPTLGLDPMQIIEIRELIRSLAAEHTILLSSHILHEVQATCSSVAIIHRGRIVVHDSLKKLTQGQRLRVSVRAGADKRDAVRKRLGALPGVHEAATRPHDSGKCSFELFFESDADALAQATYEACTKENWPLLELSRERTSLEEIFLRVAAGDATEDDA